MAQSLPRNMKVRGVRGDKEIGVTSLSFSHEDPDTFLVGTESGCIFRCSMHTKGNPAGSECTLVFSGYVYCLLIVEVTCP